MVPLLGLAMVPIIAALGAAVDYSRANNAKASLQAALDTAVLAGAKDGSSNWLTTASNTFNGSGNYTEYHVCGDLTVSGNGYLTGNAPSGDTVIVIENGSLNIAADAQVNTLRTAIVLTGTNKYPSAINFPNGKGHAATLALSPPTSNGDPWQGIALYQDPTLTSGVNDDWGPATTFNVDGMVYLPNASFGSGASNNSRCTKIVVNTFTTNGSVNLNFAHTNRGCTSLGMKQWTDTPLHLAQ